MHFRRAALALAVALLLAPSQVSAQIGVGVRWTLLRGGEIPADVTDGSDSLWGGVLRAHLSPKTSLELALDWQTITDETKTLRRKDRPFQASLLIYPVRATIAPYLIGGVGWYSRTLEVLGDDETVVSSETTRPFGMHLGFGGDLRLGRHAAFHVDYRYKFLKDNDEIDDESGIPIIGGVFDKLGLQHEGSMWTAGFTLYF